MVSLVGIFDPVPQPQPEPQGPTTTAPTTLYPTTLSPATTPNPLNPTNIDLTDHKARSLRKSQLKVLSAELRYTLSLYKAEMEHLNSLGTSVVSKPGDPRKPGRPRKNPNELAESTRRVYESRERSATAKVAHTGIYIETSHFRAQDQRNHELLLNYLRDHTPEEAIAYFRDDLRNANLKSRQERCNTILKRLETQSDEVWPDQDELEGWRAYREQLTATVKFFNSMLNPSDPDNGPIELTFEQMTVADGRTWEEFTSSLPAPNPPTPQ